VSARDAASRLQVKPAQYLGKMKCWRLPKTTPRLLFLVVADMAALAIRPKWRVPLSAEFGALSAGPRGGALQLPLTLDQQTSGLSPVSKIEQLGTFGESSSKAADQVSVSQIP